MSLSLTVFVIVMLSTVTFDGVMATPVWQRIESALYVALPALGNSRVAIIDTVGLLVFCVAFMAVYRLFATLIAHACGNRITHDAASRAFVLTLVPIAIAYLVAHYLGYFLIQGQLLIRLVSDPFGFGWDLFGTKGWYSQPYMLEADTVWHLQVGFILLGHIVSVYLAHVEALKVFRSSRQAALSQIPLLLLMVMLTTIGLWILSLPIAAGQVLLPQAMNLTLLANF